MSDLPSINFADSYNSIAEVILQMEAIDTKLQGTSLVALRNFNTTYTIITHAVYSKMQALYFDDPDRMEKFDIIFAKYYFNALNGYLNNQPIAPAWQICFDYCNNSKAPPTICMALGINAHVNNDLPQAIYEASFGQQYSQDYNKVNAILKSQITKIVINLNDRHPLFYSYNQVPFFYNFVYYQIIKAWRTKAWTQSIKLFQGQTTIAGIEKYSEDLAVLIRKSVQV